MTTVPSADRTIQLPGGRKLIATPVLDTYWNFACKRQDVFMRRVANEPPPWTDDDILLAHRFTNVYRASDRVSQYLIRRVLYAGDQSPEEVFFRALLFKLFNRIEPWELLTESFGSLEWRKFNLAQYETVLDAAMERGERIYSAAYIMPSPSFGAQRKHGNHLRLIQHMMKDGAPQKVADANSLESVFRTLRGYPSLGDFLAFQLAIDLNYSAFLNFSEMDFVVAGPGARDGIKKCFRDCGGLSDADVIRAVTDLADSEFNRLGLRFQSLWGRPLHLIDCQNLFCEVDKYARVAHPSAQGTSGRTRIKQRFVATSQTLPQWYPPKWKLQPSASLRPDPTQRARVRGARAKSPQGQLFIDLA
ncbi:nucleotide kinase domain-containing protein [Sorangium sp. So ce134]